MKNNLAPDVATFGRALELSDGRCRWRGDVAPSLAEATQPSAHNSDRRRLRHAAAVWLREALAAGPLPSKELYRQGVENGFSQGTLKRAATELGIFPHKASFDGGWQVQWTSQPVVCGRGTIARYADAVFGMLGGDGTICASSTECGEIDAGSCAPSGAETVASASLPHPGPLPEGEGGEASCAPSTECGEIDVASCASSQKCERIGAGRGTERESPEADAPANDTSPPEETSATAPREKEKDPGRRVAEATYQPSPPDEWCYVSEWRFDRMSDTLERRGDREGWKKRQLELRRDLPTMIRLEWPNIDDAPPEETTATAPHEEEDAVSRPAEGAYQPWPPNTASRPHAERPKREATVGNDDNHRLATLARKLAAPVPRPRFVVFSSRATPNDDIANEFS